MNALCACEQAAAPCCTYIPTMSATACREDAHCWRLAALLDGAMGPARGGASFVCAGTSRRRAAKCSLGLPICGAQRADRCARASATRRGRSVGAGQTRRGPLHSLRRRWQALALFVLEHSELAGQGYHSAHRPRYQFARRCRFPFFRVPRRAALPKGHVPSPPSPPLPRRAAPANARTSHRRYTRYSQSHLSSDRRVQSNAPPWKQHDGAPPEMRRC